MCAATLSFSSRIAVMTSIDSMCPLVAGCAALEPTPDYDALPVVEYTWGKLYNAKIGRASCRERVLAGV